MSYVEELNFDPTISKLVDETDRKIGYSEEGEGEVQIEYSLNSIPPRFQSEDNVKYYYFPKSDKILNSNEDNEDEIELLAEVLRKTGIQYGFKKLFQHLLKSSDAELLKITQTTLDQAIGQANEFTLKLESNAIKPEKYHWNRRFRQINKNLNEAKEENSNIENLVALNTDFANTARIYGQIICSERYLPDHKKTIKPTSIGGIAGGEKFIVRDILFKFATDDHGLYGGEEHAIKAAAHELKGLSCFLRCLPPKPELPLICMIDYRGQRLIAISLLPINKKTLMYGTADSGNTIVTDPSVQPIVENIAKQIWSKPHKVFETSSQQIKTIYLPCDIEIHEGLDNNLYALDFARVLPPQRPKAKGDVFYKKFRYEFLQRYKKPLSSDVFTGFAKYDPEESTHQKEIEEATNSLQLQYIPQFIMYLLKKEGEILDFKEELHRVGINLCYLGHIRSFIEDKDCAISKNLLTEVCTRTINKMIQATLRKEALRLCVPAEDPYRHIILHFLNEYMLKNSNNFWLHSELKDQINQRFELCLTTEEKRPDFDLRKRIDIRKVFEKLTRKSGIMIKEEILRILRNTPIDTETGELVKDFELIDSDIEMRSIVKEMDIISSAAAKLLHKKAKLIEDVEEKLRILRVSEQGYSSASTADPQNIEKLFDWITILRDISELTIFEDEKFRVLELILEKCSSIILQNPENRIYTSNSLYFWCKSISDIWEYCNYKQRGTFLESFVTAIANVDPNLQINVRTLDACRQMSKLIWSRFIESIAIDEPIPETLFVQMGKLFDWNVSIFRPLFDVLPFPRIRNEEIREGKRLVFGTIEMLVVRAAQQCEVLKQELISQFSKLEFTSLVVESQSKAVIMTNSMLKALFETLPIFEKGKLNSLELNRLDITNEFLIPFIDKMAKNIQNLYLIACINLTDTLFEAISNSNLASSLKRLSCSGTSISDNGFCMLLKNCINLEYLSLDNCNQISDNGILQLGTVLNTKLQVLNLAWCYKITDRGFTHLIGVYKSLKSVNFSKLGLVDTNLKLLASNCSKTLTVCNLDGCKQLTEKGFKFLAACQELQELYLGNCSITDKSLKSVAKLKSLISLQLDNGRDITDAGIKYIAKGCTLLRSLTLFKCSHIGDSAIQSLACSATQLKILDLSYLSEITDAALHSLAEHCKELEELNLRSCQKITNDGLKYLSQYSHNLRSINLYLCLGINDSGLQYLAKCSKLEVLSIGKCLKLSDTGIEYIAQGCPKLKELHSDYNEKITDNAVKFLVTNCSLLQSLTLSGCPNISDISLKLISESNLALKELKMGQANKITGNGWKVFSGSPDLSRLKMFSTEIGPRLTSSTIQALKFSGQF